MNNIFLYLTKIFFYLYIYMNYLFNDNDFKKKYFKYKQKYINYKESIVGGYPTKEDKEDDEGFIEVKGKDRKSKEQKEKKEERLISIDDIRCNTEFINLLNIYKPLSVFVYGSTARGTNKLTSDIDFMVIWKKTPSDPELLIIKDTIKKIFNKEIDFVSMVLTKEEVDKKDENYNYMENVYIEGIVVYGDSLKYNILLSRKVVKT